MTPEWTDLAAAYALDALDADERTAFEARLDTDSELRRLVDTYRSAVAAVGESLPRIEPPAGLRDRILARAREESRARPAGAGELEGSPPEPMPARAPGTLRPGRGARASRLAWPLLAAAVAGLFWVGARNRQLLRESQDLSDQLTQVRAALGDAEGELQRLDSLALLLSGPEIRFATLTAEGVAPGLRLLWNPAAGTLLVAASGLPSPAEGRTYQLWGIRGTEDPVSLGTFETGPDGTALVTLAPPAGADFELSAVTEEPDGGSPQPTSQPFLAGPWRVADP
jgi:anti-sigma-K factor RskA